LENGGLLSTLCSHFFAEAKNSDGIFKHIRATANSLDRMLSGPERPAPGLTSAEIRWIPQHRRGALVILEKAI